MDKNGVAHSFHGVLTEIYLELDCLTDDGWGVAYTHSCIKEQFNYQGPLPEWQELLLVEHYLIWAGVRQSWRGENI